MAMHLALYSASVASTAQTQIAAIADPLMAPAGSGLLVNSLVPKVARIFGVGGILVRAQLNAPSFRDFTPFDVSPINVGAIIGSPARMVDMANSPFPLQVNEELDAFVVNSGAIATQTSVAVLMTDGPINRVQGRIFTVHFTSTTGLAVAAWAAFTPVFDNGLPSGTFAVVGSRLRSTTGLFHRYIPRGGTVNRPGTVMMQAADDGYPLALDRYGLMGEWLRFTNTTPPQIEAFALAADAAGTISGFMDLIQVA